MARTAGETDLEGGLLCTPSPVGNRGGAVATSVEAAAQLLCARLLRQGGVKTGPASSPSGGEKDRSELHGLAVTQRGVWGGAGELALVGGL